MADAAVEFLLENLKQLLLYHGNLIGDAKTQVEKLERDLRIFKAFLRDTSKKRRKDDKLQELVRQIRDVVYEAEDIVDSFVTQAAFNRSMNYFLRAFKKPVDLHAICKNVEAISRKVGEIYFDKTRIDFDMLDVREGDLEDSEVPELRRVNVVGFEDEVTRLKGYLSESTGNVDVISIIGMPGLGKTTLAGMIFYDEEIKFEFSTRIWVYISSEFKRKDVFLAILKQLTTKLTDNILYHTSERELAELVAAELDNSGKFLIVMDDVWTVDDWDKIKTALPRNNNTGKVLITSRQKEVGLRANCNRDPHELRFLTHEESCLLLCLEALGKHEFPKELRVFGHLIAMQCGGLPLAIVVIGGILRKKENAWERVSKRVSDYLNEDPEKKMEKIISLSYDKLPYHLRACFLHLGSMFPEDFEIPVWKLIRMWIAEGFIQQEENMTLEETAENYLEEIINRNLVRIEKMSHDGRVKSCRIYAMLRDFCKKKAGPQEENFLQEIKSIEGGFEPPVFSEEEKLRRLCIHSNVLRFLSSKPAPYGPRVRSFACFSNEDFTLPAENNSSITSAFKLLRVIDVKPIKFTQVLPPDLYHLIHLKYMHIFFSSSKIPAAFDKLWNIQTLIVDTTSRTLEIKADIWQMIHLRHLKTNASTTLPKTGEKSKGGEKLQTLGTISPQSCTEDVFNRACNLKKLGIRGRLSSLLDGKNGSFDSLGKLNKLEKLKLLNDAFPSASSEGKLHSLPPPYKFPPHLRSLTLSETFLDWSYMSTIGSLDNLKVLKLKENAFVGEFWLAANGGFSLLEVLHIGRTDLAVWEASWDNFPKLKVLELHNCEELRHIPTGFADIPNLRLLDLYRSKHATASAKKIEKAKKEKLVDGSGFKLSIFPPAE